MTHRKLLIVSVIFISALNITAARAEVLIGVGGPLTGKDAWFGEQLQLSVELAVADINGAGGVLGQAGTGYHGGRRLRSAQAVAAARKLVSEEVIFVVGHYCSHAAIPASAVYDAAGVILISPASINPMLTDLGHANVFRVIPRNDADAIAIGNYLADHWADKKIAILHDSTLYGKGIAEGTRKQLRHRGLTETIYRTYVPGKDDYETEITELETAHIAVVFIGGYHTEIALMARAAHDRDYPVQLVAGPSLATEEFGLIAGPAAEGTLFTFLADPRRNAEAAPVVERFRASGFEPEGYTLHAYGAVQVWAQAVEKAGSLELQAVIASLRQHQFDTVLGVIDFDQKGDVTTQIPVWNVWRSGTYVPLE
jgi:branched-chain amino acid transport system substrate-binding protein